MCFRTISAGGEHFSGMSWIAAVLQLGGVVEGEGEVKWPGYASRIVKVL